MSHNVIRDPRAKWCVVLKAPADLSDASLPQATQQQKHEDFLCGVAPCAISKPRRPSNVNCFGSPLSSNVVVCGHCLNVTLSLTINIIKMALIAAHLNAEVILVVAAGVAIGI